MVLRQNKRSQRLCVHLFHLLGAQKMIFATENPNRVIGVVLEMHFN